MGVKKINIKFDVLRNNNPKNIVIIDISEWGHIEDKPSIIEIIVPGFEEPVVHYFDKRQLSYYNSENLGLVCTDCPGSEEEYDLPDGLYEITVKGSPDKFNSTIFYLKTDKIRLDLDALFLKINFCKDFVDSEYLKKIQKIDVYIKSAEANVRYGNICEAQELLIKAQADMKKLTNCKTCG